MSDDAKRQAGPLRRWLQKVRQSWRRAGDMGDRASATRRADYTQADRRGPPRTGDPGQFGGGL
jgi:hypothetical protein